MGYLIHFFNLRVFIKECVYSKNNRTLVCTMYINCRMKLVHFLGKSVSPSWIGPRTFQLVSLAPGIFKKI